MKKKTLIIFSAFLFLSSCLMKKTVPGNNLPAFDKEAHRGGRGLMPENTLPAMMHALSLDITTLEMDAVITKDGKVVLSHEPFFNHEITTKPDGRYVTEAEERQLNIYRFTYDEMKRYDVGIKPHPRFPRQEKLNAVKPLLSDVIDSVENYCKRHHRAPVFYNIETKSDPTMDNVFHPLPRPYVDALMKVIESKNISPRVIIQSFDFRTLKIMHEKYPSIKTAMLIESFDKRQLDEQLAALGFVPDIYSPEQSLVTEKLVNDCHSKKMKIIPWTVNEKEKIQELKNMGVDGLITDYPDLFKDDYPRR